MKYYKIDIQGRFPKENRILGQANGEKILNGKLFFDRMGKGEIIRDAPFFSDFFLQSYDKPEFWDWRLQDIHGFIGEYPTGGAWYISHQLKTLLEQFNIAKGFWFYPTKLSYKEEKKDYWIFQFAAIDNGMSNKSYIDFSKSVFKNPDNNDKLTIKNLEEYNTIRKKIEEDSDYEKDIITQKISLTEDVDFITFFGINSEGIIISEKLKKAIENSSIEGFEFSDINFEIETA